MAKTAHKPQMAAKEVPVLTREQMIAEVRNLRAGKLFVGNMEFIDAVRDGLDQAVAERDAALKAIQDAIQEGARVLAGDSFANTMEPPAGLRAEVAGPGAEG